MLPFLKPKHVAGLIISKRKPDGGGVEESHSVENEGQPLEMAAEDLIRAFHAKDAKSVAACLRAAIEIIQDEPSEDSEDYDSQNEKAADYSKE